MLCTYREVLSWVTYNIPTGWTKQDKPVGLGFHRPKATNVTDVNKVRQDYFGLDFFLPL